VRIDRRRRIPKRPVGDACVTLGQERSPLKLGSRLCLVAVDNSPAEALAPEPSDWTPG
jgi:hypothetical protein